MSLQGLVDYHLHTAVTVDADMTEAEACQRAVALGLQEIAFTNHVMLAQPDYIVSPQELVDHWAQIQVCQQRYPELTIRLGLEMDYYEGREDDIASTIQRYEEIVGRRFDFIMGAIHHLNGVFFGPTRNAPLLFNDQKAESIYHDYFVLMTKAVRSGLFDIMAHPDLIKKYTGKFHPPVPFDRYRAPAETFVQSLLEAEVGIEVNASGLRRPVGEIYPSRNYSATGCSG
jgi:histidinol-phosphatase (PHP family)